jgi:hypothetical protein
MGCQSALLSTTYHALVASAPVLVLSGDAFGGGCRRICGREGWHAASLLRWLLRASDKAEKVLLSCMAVSDEGSSGWRAGEGASSDACV